MEEKRKIKIEYEIDEETFNIVLDTLTKKYEEEIRHYPGERLSDFIQYLREKKRELLG